MCVCAEIAERWIIFNECDLKLWMEWACASPLSALIGQLPFSLTDSHSPILYVEVTWFKWAEKPALKITQDSSHEDERTTKTNEEYYKSWSAWTSPILVFSESCNATNCLGRSWGHPQWWVTKSYRASYYETLALTYWIQYLRYLHTYQLHIVRYLLKWIHIIWMYQPIN